MVMCIKQHLCNIWSSIYEKVKQHWGWVEKSVPYKKACILSGQYVPAFGLKTVIYEPKIYLELCPTPMMKFFAKTVNALNQYQVNVTFM